MISLTVDKFHVTINLYNCIINLIITQNCLLLRNKTGSQALPRSIAGKIK